MKIIGAALTSILNYIVSSMLKHCLSIKELRIALPEKLDGTRLKFLGLINKI